MRLFKNKSLHHKKKSLHSKKHSEKIEIKDNLQNKVQQINFEEFVGHTVTVYVNAGGMAGNGFTGVLLQQTATYIRLLVLPSIPPSCSLGSKCRSNDNNNILHCMFCPFNRNSTLGSTADILISNIVAFVHNTLTDGYCQ